MKKFVVAIGSPGIVDMYKTEAADEHQAIISVLKKLEGFEDWDLDKLSPKQLKHELSVCDMAADAIEV